MLGWFSMNGLRRDMGCESQPLPMGGDDPCWFFRDGLDVCVLGVVTLCGRWSGCRVVAGCISRVPFACGWDCLAPVPLAWGDGDVMVEVALSSSVGGCSASVMRHGCASAGHLSLSPPRWRECCHGCQRGEEAE